MITPDALRHSNSFETTGHFGAHRAVPLEALVIEYIDLEHELARKPEIDQKILKMLAEGYAPREIAAIVGVSRRKLAQRIGIVLDLVPATHVIPMLTAARAPADELLFHDPRG